MDDAFSEGQYAYVAEVPREDCPYSDDPVGRVDREAWLAGWDQMASDNSQFGVGA
jgi:ribosome modulation factor